MILAKTGFAEQEKKTFKESTRILIRLFLVLLVIKVLYLGITVLIDLLDKIMIPAVSNNFEVDTFSGTQKFILTALIVPIIEELTFRLGLRFSKINFLIMFSGIAYMMSKLILQLQWYTSLCIAGMAVLLLALVLKDQIVNRMAEFWKSNRLIVFYSLLFAFAFLHMSNYDLRVSMLPYVPFMVISHLLGGLVFSYARFKYGMVMAIGLHVLNNALFSFPLLFAS